MKMKNTQQMLSGWLAALPGVQRGLLCVHRTPPALNLAKYNVVLDLNSTRKRSTISCQKERGCLIKRQLLFQMKKAFRL